jgi:hypothetical protein
LFCRSLTAENYRREAAIGKDLPRLRALV